MKVALENQGQTQQLVKQSEVSRWPLTKVIHRDKSLHSDQELLARTPKGGERPHFQPPQEMEYPGITQHGSEDPAEGDVRMLGGA